MKKIKVITIVGTRPELIRLSRVIAKLKKAIAIEHVLVHTGQNYDYELNQIFFDDLNLPKPDYFLDAADQTATKTIGKILIAVDDLLLKENPDALLVLGDTNSCLSAIPAKKRHIPIFHMEAGNRCFDQRVPEETNRKIVDHISDINLTYSDIAREYLLREGLPADRIIKTGSPMYEVLDFYKAKIEKSSILSQLNLLKENYFLVSCHREENVNNDSSFKNLIQTLNILESKYQLPIIVSTHPRTQKILEKNNLSGSSLIRFLKPFGFTDYNALQMSAKAVLSDSGTISEESSILGFPALNIRQAHERPEAMEEASVMMTGLNADRILQGIETLSYEMQSGIEFKRVQDYSMPNVSDKVIRIIVSYVDYIKRVVWQNE
ncbi:MAG: non-hydrolyzing UDP-N-acetylglucosamine 2-epimerase [Cyclobacteriaceae bacterium]